MFEVSGRAARLCAALLADALVGDPDWLWRRLPHPVVWVGRAVARLERSANQPEYSARRRRRAGVALAGGGTAAALALGSALGWVLRGSAEASLHTPSWWSSLGAGAEVLCVAVLLSWRSLHQHVAAVAAALEGAPPRGAGGWQQRGGGGGREGEAPVSVPVSERPAAADRLAAARDAVSRIAGRDPAHLDAAAVARTAVESAAENLCDGVVAPVCWYAVLGLPGILAYKTINTMDSMIGYPDPRHRDFGWAAARLDDLVNWLPARLTAVLLIGAAALLPGAKARAAWRTVRRDARRHPSPNAGWPEAAAAGALDLRLGGPRRYPHHESSHPWLGTGSTDPRAEGIRGALRLNAIATAGLGAAAAVVALAAIAHG